MRCASSTNDAEYFKALKSGTDIEDRCSATPTPPESASPSTPAPPARCSTSSAWRGTGPTLRPPKSRTKMKSRRSISPNEARAGRCSKTSRHQDLRRAAARGLHPNASSCPGPSGKATARAYGSNLPGAAERRHAQGPNNEELKDPCPALFRRISALPCTQLRGRRRKRTPRRPDVRY